MTQHAYKFNAQVYKYFLRKDPGFFAGRLISYIYMYRVYNTQSLTFLRVK